MELLVVFQLNPEAVIVFLSKKFVIERFRVVDEEVLIGWRSGATAELDEGGKS